MPGRTESFETIHKGVPVVRQCAVNINVSSVKVAMWAKKKWDDAGLDPDRTLHGRMVGLLDSDQAYTNQPVTQVVDVHPDVQGRLRMHPEVGSAWLDSEDRLEKIQSDIDEASDFTSEDSISRSGWAAESKARERSRSNKNKKKAARKPKAKAKNAQAKAKAKNAQAKAKAKQRAMELAIERMPCAGVGGI